MFRSKKGTPNYIKSGRIRQFSIALCLLLISVALYFAGIKATGSNKNALTYVAILGCLPAAKFMVNFVLFMKAKGCSDALMDKLVKAGFKGFYDLYFTTYKKNFQVSAAYYRKGTLIGITEDENCDTAACEEHLATSLKTAGFEVTVKIFKDADKFMERYSDLSKLSDETDISFLKDNLLNISI